MSITIEQMRADVAAMIHEEPDAIGLEDDLIDLGLDSMRLLTLVLKWQEQGVDLDFVAFAERSTIAGWWAAIEQHRAAGAS
jgi:aryl carrier-like protein